MLNQTTIHHTVTPLLDTPAGAAARLQVHRRSGLAIMLWSGSRWLNVYVDTITIMYGLNGRRHFLKTRALSFTLYLVMLLVSIVLLPAPGGRPGAARPDLPGCGRASSNVAYWPVVVAASRSSSSRRSITCPCPSGRRGGVTCPAPLLALVIWLVGSFLLRFYLDTSVDRNSAYGSLAAPIAVLFWLYVTALAVLIGAGLNAVVDRTVADRADGRSALEKAAALQPVREQPPGSAVAPPPEAMEDSVPVLERRRRRDAPSRRRKTR